VPAQAGPSDVRQRLDAMRANGEALPWVPVRAYRSAAPVFADPNLAVDIVPIANAAVAQTQPWFALNPQTQEGYGLQVSAEGRIRVFFYTALHTDLGWSGQFLMALWGLRQTIVTGQFATDLYPADGKLPADLTHIDELFGARAVHDGWIGLQIAVGANAEIGAAPNEGDDIAATFGDW
jgi:hypothetical protein